jgi:8-oxo-dGTP diphosphatase
MNTDSPFYRVSLKAVVFDEQGRLLVLQTSDKAWELPGGGWEHSESLEDCLSREISEELQVEVAHIRPSALCFYRGKNERGYATLKIVLAVTLSTHDFTPSDGMVATKFITKQELQALEMDDGERGIKDYADQIWPTVEK